MELSPPFPSRLRRPIALPHISRPLALVIAGSVVAVTAGGVFAAQRFFTPPPAPAGQIVSVQRGTVASTVSATGSTVAARQAKLVFQTTGRIKEIPVNLGDQVKAGQPLARLASDALQNKLDGAQSQLAVAQLKLQQLTEGATAEEVAAAQAAYDAASAKLSDLQAGATPADLQAARAGVASAQASYDAAAGKLQTMLNGSNDADLATGQAGLDSAQNALATAEAKLEQLKKGALPEDVAAARSTVDQATSNLAAAQSKLEQAKAAAQTTPDVVQSQAAYDQALSTYNNTRAKLDQVRTTSKIPVEVYAAQAAYDQAKAAFDALADQLTQAQADFTYRTNNLEALKLNVQSTCDKYGDSSSECRNASSAVDAAYAPLYAAEATLRDVDPTRRANDVKSALSALSSARAKLEQAQANASVPADLIAAQGAFDAASSGLASARLKLEQVKASVATDLTVATLAYDAARSASDSARSKQRSVQQGPTDPDLVAAQTAVDTARSNLTAAQAKLDSLGNSTQQDARTQQSAVAGARAAVDSARAKLAQVQQGATGSDVASAQSAIAAAQSAFAQKSGVTRPSDVGLQQESVRQAELAVAQAQIDLDNATLTAPFDGVVASIAGNVGEQASSGTTGSGTTGFITLLDPTQVRVDVTVDETDVARLKLGEVALVTFDALPDRPYVGRVLAVSPSGTLTQGVVTYPVSLSIEPARFGPGGNTQGVVLGSSAGGSDTAGVAGGAADQSPATQSGAGRAQGQGQAGARGAAGQRQNQPEQAAALLPAGLTASVVITVDHRDDVLTVPNRAIKRQGRDQVVDVVSADGKTETRVVRTGMANDQVTEIVEGLGEGDRVLVAVTTARQPSANVGGPVPGAGPGGGLVVRR